MMLDEDELDTLVELLVELELLLSVLLLDELDPSPVLLLELLLFELELVELELLELELELEFELDELESELLLDDWDEADDADESDWLDAELFELETSLYTSA